MSAQTGDSSHNTGCHLPVLSSQCSQLTPAIHRLPWVFFKRMCLDIISQRPWTVKAMGNCIQRAHIQVPFPEPTEKLHLGPLVDI